MMIVVEHLKKSYGRVQALDDVSLQVSAGEIVALLGPNGAGKTTLIKCLLGLTRFSGSITLDGVDVRQAGKQAKRLLGYVPQGPVFYDMRADELLCFFAKLRSVRLQRVAEVLEIVGLSRHAAKPTRALSSGMRQRLSFALALLPDPPILILDEPTSDLDAAARAEFLERLKGLKRQAKTVVFSSHRLDEVGFLADRVVILHHGRVMGESAPGELPHKLGLKSRLCLRVAPGHEAAAQAVLTHSGISHRLVSDGILSLEVKAGEKLTALQLLQGAAIPVEDFTVEEPSMEAIIGEVIKNGP